MSLGLVIENIAGSIRQLPLPEAGGAAGNTDAGKAAPEASGAEPGSGQAQLSPGFTVVVLQLLNEQGAVVSTIPSAQQLAAYRNGTATPP